MNFQIHKTVSTGEKSISTSASLDLSFDEFKLLFPAQEFIASVDQISPVQLLLCELAQVVG